MEPEKDSPEQHESPRERDTEMPDAVPEPKVKESLDDLMSRNLVDFNPPPPFVMG